MKLINETTITKQQIKNGEMLMNFSHSYRGAMINPESTRRAVRDILESKAYKDYVTWGIERVAGHRTFCEFFITPMPEGLGEDINELRNLCRSDPELLDMLDRDSQVSRHQGINQHTPNVGNADSADAASLTPHHHSSQGIIRRLRRDHPELHQQVVKGKLTPNEAAVKAGFRPRRRSISLEDAESAYNTISKYASDEFRNELIRLLLQK